jgi:hypothetical protein
MGHVRKWKTNLARYHSFHGIPEVRHKMRIVVHMYVRVYVDVIFNTRRIFRRKVENMKKLFRSHR